jgi:hypothetical protein
VFTDQDTTEAQRVIVVDEALAQRFWPNGDAIGKRMRRGGPRSEAPWMTVVGVVGSVKQYGLDIEGRMVVYYPHTQSASGGMFVVARTAVEPASLISAATSALRSIDPDLPIVRVNTMDRLLADSLARRRFSLILLGSFAAFAMLLATIGVFGVTSYLVSQGTQEIGLRIALGSAACADSQDGY